MGGGIKFSFAGHDISLTTFVPMAVPIGLNYAMAHQVQNFLSLIQFSSLTPSPLGV